MYSKVDACGGGGESWREGRTEEALAALIVDGGGEIVFGAMRSSDS